MKSKNQRPYLSPEERKLSNIIYVIQIFVLFVVIMFLTLYPLAEIYGGWNG